MWSMSVSYPSKSATRLCPFKRCRCHVLRFILKRVSHQPLNKDAQEAPTFPLLLCSLFSFLVSANCFHFSLSTFPLSVFTFVYLIRTPPFFHLPLATLSFLDSPFTGLSYHTKQQKRENDLRSPLSRFLI